MRILDGYRLEKKVLQIVEMKSVEDTAAWETKTPAERLAGLEILRQMWSSYDPDTERLPRIYSIIEPT